MLSLPEMNGCWLDRGSTDGITIREDVRTAAGMIWRRACRKTRISMGDDSETGALMEVAVAQTAKYLNGLSVPLSPQRAQAVLTAVFARLLYRRAMRLERLEPIGDRVESMFSVPSWEDQVNNDLFLEKLTRHMGSRGVKILLLRRDGYTWDDIALTLKSTQTAVKKCFWRAIKNAKTRLNIGARKKEAGASKSYAAQHDSRRRDEISARRHGSGRG